MEIDHDKRKHNFHKMTDTHNSSKTAKARFVNRKRLILNSTNKYPGTYDANFNPIFSLLAAASGYIVPNPSKTNLGRRKLCCQY